MTGRFAPSPSGRMHLGNAFAALLAWLSVRAQGGRMLLRIEDLDPQRSRAEYAQLLRDDLRWLGLTWDDEAPPQSGRGDFYQKQLDVLEEKGLLYPCFCSRAELHAASAPHAGEARFVYGGRCRTLRPEEEAAARAAGRRPALRVRVPEETVGFCDGCQGGYEENLAKATGDFIVRRSDGVFAYQLAAPADDGDQGVTEVVRGRDLLSSTPRQIWLMRELGYTPPRYCHVPLLLAPDGRRLSKREQDLDLGRLRARFQTSEPLIGMLAYWAGLLERPEPVTAQQLVKGFGWDKVRREDVCLPAEEGIFRE